MADADSYTKTHSNPTNQSTNHSRCKSQPAPRRSAPYDEEPGFYIPGGLWLYGNVRLFHSELAFVASACGPPTHTAEQLDAIDKEAESLVLGHKVLVCGIHNEAHQQAAIVPLRWGAPRILVVPGGFKHHLGEDLDQEPFRAARLWRYRWDQLTDLAVSRRAPDKRPTYTRHNPTVDRMIKAIAIGEHVGLRSPDDPLTFKLSRQL